MKTKNQISSPHPNSQQRGAALIILMLAIVLSLVTLVTFRSERKGPELEAERKTALALARAKEALLGRAASDNDPGTLSCPSINLSGIANNLGDCDEAPAPSIIPMHAGRFPWRTLAVGDIYDGAGERLWYVISSNFIDTGKSVVPGTPGTLSVNGGPMVAAVIIAPGLAINGQTRSTGNDTIMTNYLESFMGGVTINTNIPLTNDRIITIGTAELFNLVTQRVARVFALELSAEINGPGPGTYPPTGWLPPNWSTGHFQNWKNATVTEFTNLSPTKGTLKFISCVGEFTIEKVGGNDAAVTGKVSC